MNSRVRFRPFGGIDRRPLNETRVCTTAQTFQASYAYDRQMVNLHRLVVVALALLPLGGTAGAEDLARYRGFVLGSGLTEVAKTGGLRVVDVRTVHSRPDLIQEIVWRPPYMLPTASVADPVRQAVLGFHNGLLYRIAVTYDRDRVQGMTDEDIV